MSFWDALGGGLTAGGNSLNQLAQYLAQREEQDLNRRMMGIFPTGEQPQEQYRDLNTGTDLGVQIPSSPTMLAQQAASGIGMAGKPSPANVPPTSMKIGLAKGPEQGSSGIGLAPRALAQTAASKAPPPAEFVTKSRPYADAVDMGGGYTYVPSASMSGVQFARQRQANREDAEAEARRALEDQMKITDYGFNLEQNADRDLRNEQNRQAYGTAIELGFATGEYNANTDYARLVEAELDLRRTNAMYRSQQSQPKTPQTWRDFALEYGPQYSQPRPNSITGIVEAPDPKEMMLQLARIYSSINPNDPDPEFQALLAEINAPPPQTDMPVDDGNAFGDFLGSAKDFAARAAGAGKSALGFGAPPIDTTMRGDVTAPPGSSGGERTGGKSLPELRAEYDEAVRAAKAQGWDDERIRKEIGIRP